MEWQGGGARPQGPERGLGCALRVMGILGAGAIEEGGTLNKETLEVRKGGPGAVPTGGGVVRPESGWRGGCARWLTHLQRC